MENWITLALGVFLIYLLFSRKGGMGCCGGHGTHGNGPDGEKHGDSRRRPDGHTRHGAGMGCCGGHGGEDGEPNSADRPTDDPPASRHHIIDLTRDQYTVLPVEEHRERNKADQVAPEKTN